MAIKDYIFKNQSPWGSNPSGGSRGGNGDGNGAGAGRREPPNIDDIIRNIQKTINRFLPGGKSGGGADCPWPFYTGYCLGIKWLIPCPT